MREIFKKHKTLWIQKSFLLGISTGLIFLSVGMLATYYANSFTLTHVSNAVTDILLDNIPVLNVDVFFNEGAMVFVLALFLILLNEPKRMPFVLKSVALFVLIRSFFMILTHLAPPIDKSFIDTQDYIYKISSGGDLFFSAHTGLPFMLAFIFWNEKFLKYLFLACSMAGAIVVILGHLHYSIDVFSALFIAYGIFCISQKLFPNDYQLLIR